jgi:hypothetical protein
MLTATSEWVRCTDSHNVQEDGKIIVKCVKIRIFIKAIAAFTSDSENPASKVQSATITANLLDTDSLLIPRGMRCTNEAKKRTCRPDI